jgi:hypothetical protein
MKHTGAHGNDRTADVSQACNTQGCGEASAAGDGPRNVLLFMPDDLPFLSGPARGLSRAL